MAWWSPRARQPAVLHVSPADAAPGDELLWATRDESGTRHHAVEVGVVMHDPYDGHVTVLGHDGDRHEFDAQQLVVLLRGLHGLLEHQRVSGPTRPVSAGHAP